MRHFIRCSLVASALVLAANLSSTTSADEEKTPTIKEIMQESHQCGTAYIRTVREQLRKEEPDWPLVETKSRGLAKNGKQLAKNTPPKGTKEAWEKITSVYTANAILMTDAAERHDKDTANRHQQAMTRMCAACHRAHR